MKNLEIVEREVAEWLECYADYNGLELADKLRNQANGLDMSEDYNYEVRDELLELANKAQTDGLNDFHNNIESMLTSNGYSFTVNYASTGSIYYSFWKTNDESDEPKTFKLRVANHQQLYDADFSIDPYGITIDQFSNILNNLKGDLI